MLFRSINYFLRIDLIKSISSSSIYDLDCFFTTGLFRSTSSGTLDIWHTAQRFTSRPALNDSFIRDTPPISRVSAVPTQPQILFDGFYKIRMVRPIPMYSTPANLGRF